ncbi:MAG: hypothetical protein H0X17_13115 [Deltaproteobacteria bacterium]|nr:hypothetical protein [Deltaproteobacteria bacterium]
MHTIPRARHAMFAGLAAGLAVMVAASPASADVSGTYDVKFEDVSTNCTTQKLTYKPQPISVKVKANTLTIDIDLMPVLTGVPQKTGKVSAKSRAGSTMIGGMKGVFSVAGRITPDGNLSLVMVGEYSTEQGKPLCTQSWNVSGPRSNTKPRK